MSMSKPITSLLPAKIILDTNFYVSLGFGGLYHKQLFDLLTVDYPFDYQLILSDAIFHDIKAKLYGDRVRSKLQGYTENRMNLLLEKILATHILVTPILQLPLIQDLSDVKDMLLFELAAQESADFILTNDKQVLKQNPFGVAEILTYKEFWGRLVNNEG
jgi:predicted nucleic acid-binding protein